MIPSRYNENHTYISCSIAHNSQHTIGGWISSSSSGICLVPSDLITGRGEMNIVVTLLNIVFTTQVLASDSAKSSSSSSGPIQ